YIIDRMLEHGFITAEEAEAARKEELRVRSAANFNRNESQAGSQAEFVAELVRQLIYAQYGEETYTRGLKVHTTIRMSDQEVAYQALRQGLINYERRQPYRGPEKFITLPSDSEAAMDAAAEALLEQPDNGDMVAAVVLEAEPRKVVALKRDGETIEITGRGLNYVQEALQPRATTRLRI